MVRRQPDVSDEHIAPVFRFKEELTGFKLSLLDLIFDSEERQYVSLKRRSVTELDGGTTPKTVLFIVTGARYSN